MTLICLDCMDDTRCEGQHVLEPSASSFTPLRRALTGTLIAGCRWGVVALVALLAASTVALAVNTFRLEERLLAEQSRVSGMVEVLAQTTTQLERLDTLEAHVGASRRVIAGAAESIMFVQGAYGFVEAESGKPLRFLGLGPDGQPLRNRSGAPFIAVGDEGPIAEMFFSGTAFVATNDGLLITNRHIALPWEFDDGAKALVEQGYTPVMRGFVGYLAGAKEPFEVELVVASDEADIAVLRGSGLAGQVTPLTLGEVSPELGDDVLVLGYPTGMRALLARTDETLVSEITSGYEVDFWTVARRLSTAGRINPLATRGIVGQVSSVAVVYDAETTSGGSGGPVIDIHGQVVAINSAVFPEFGGANLGVPARQARELLALAQTKEDMP